MGDDEPQVDPPQTADLEVAVLVFNESPGERLPVVVTNVATGVVLSPPNSLTDTNGIFQLTGLERNIQVEAVATYTNPNGMATTGRGSTALTAQNNFINIDINPQTATADLLVRVLRLESPVAGVSVFVRNQTTNQLLSAPNDLTDNAGEYRLFGLPVGMIVVAGIVFPGGNPLQSPPTGLNAGLNTITIQISGNSISVSSGFSTITNLSRGIEPAVSTRSVESKPTKPATSKKDPSAKAKKEKPAKKAATEKKPATTKKAAPKNQESDLIASRKESHIGSMYGFNESGNYAKNRTYNAALDFVQGNQKAKALTDGYAEAMGKLLSLHNRDSISPEKKADYGGMIETVTLSFLDKLVAASPDAIPTGGKDALEKAIDSFHKGGVDIKAIKKAWKGSALKKETGAKSIDQINKMLK
jgi:hypothetical protein